MVKPFLHPTRILSGDVLAAAAPHSTGRFFLTVLVVPAGGHQLLLPSLCLLSPSQHCPSKLLRVSQCLPLEMSRCCSLVRLETAPFLPFTVGWVISAVELDSAGSHL